MRRLAVAVALTLPACLDSPPDGIGPEPDPTYRKRLTIPAGAVAAPLDDFPLLVNLAGDLDLAAHAATDGLDLAFRDADGGLLDVEVELWQPETSHLRAWVKVPLVASETDTDLYLHYGGEALEPGDPAAVWTNGYALVWHLDEEPAAMLDSTAGGHHAREVFGLVDRGEGYLGASAVFPGGETAYISFGPDLPAAVDVGGVLTVTAWVRYDAIIVSSHFVSKAPTGANDHGWGMGISGGGELMVRAMNGDGESRGVSSDAPPDPGTWYHLAMVFDGGQVGDDLRLRGFRDGQALAFDYPASIPPAFDAQGGPLYIGCATWNPDYCIAGAVDELRVAAVARSPEWIAAEYANQVAGSTFLVIGEEEPL